MAIAALLNADPRPANTGSRIRDGVLVDQLRTLDSVDVFAFGTETNGPGYQVLPHRSFPLAAAAAGRRRRMVMQERYAFDTHGRALLDAARTALLVHAAELYAGSWVTEKGISAPLVWSSHDDDQAVWDQRASASRPAVARAYRREGRLAAASVRRVLQRADLLIPCTNADAEIMRSRGANGRIEVIANGAWFDKWDPCAAEGPTSQDVVIFGSMAQKVTAAGMEWFLEEVVPVLRRCHPSVRFRVIGRSGSSALEARLADVPNLSRLADVGSIPDAVRGGAVVAIPQVRGTGSKLKTIETMACGLPAVCTTAATVGLDWLPSTFAVHDDPTTFAGAVLDRLDRPVFAPEERTKARDRFDWNVLGRAYREAVTDLVGINVPILTEGNSL